MKIYVICTLVCVLALAFGVTQGYSQAKVA